MIRVVHPGSGCWLSTHPGSRGQKGTGSGSATLVAHLEAKFLEEIQTKVLIRVFLLTVIHYRLYSFALRFILLQIHATSYNFYSSVTVLYTVKEKGGNPDRKPYLLPYDLRNLYRNLKSMRTLKVMPRNLNEIVRSWIRIWDCLSDMDPDLS